MKYTLIHKKTGLKFYVDENTISISYMPDKFEKIEDRQQTLI